MSSGAAKKLRRRVRRPGRKREDDVQALKTARAVRSEMATEMGVRMALKASGDGLARDLGDLQGEHKRALRTITDLKWLLALVSFVLGLTVVLFIVDAVT